MIPVLKLAKLHPRHRLRKAALVLAEAERRLRSAEAADAPELGAYVASLAAFFAADADTAPELRARADRIPPLARALSAGAAAPGDRAAVGALVRAVDDFRHALIRETGQAPADWDLLDPATGRPDAASRRVHPGMRAYLEDLRSPFNVGSMFRTADAFGLEELILSPDSADPAHARAARSSMGAVDLVPWRRAALADLASGVGVEAAGGSPGQSPGADPGEGPGIFALELGGTPLDEFDFPRRGIVIVGSEELGVSPAALARCDLGRVSIPMAGAKGSLNAGVAFGILLCAWSRHLETMEE
ncbi:MAG: TrmH family RNA methyltransferase [Spirochaetaceae bacterium]|nr:TrmH family RNA methyltransferase [Spirochaetaceae bacterium]